MLVEPASLAFAPMGPELTSRFFGVSNLLESLLLGPALIGARLLAARFGPIAFAAVAALALATIAENQLGSDGGGAIVVGVAFALLAVQMIGARRAYTLPALGIAALVVLGLVNLDAAASGPDHLRGAVQGGFAGLERRREPCTARVLPHARAVVARVPGDRGTRDRRARRAPRRSRTSARSRLPCSAVSRRRSSSTTRPAPC